MYGRCRQSGNEASETEEVTTETDWDFDIDIVPVTPQIVSFISGVNNG
jgi:hypothetical protein